MAPEFQPNLVLLDLSLEDSELQAAVSAVERSYEARSRGDYVSVTWSANSQPAGCFSLGDGAVYVRETPGLERFSYPAQPDSLGGSRYRWRYGVHEPVMLVIVFPKGHVATDFEPTPLRAKLTQSGRLAAYWILQGIDKGDSEVKWTVQKAHSSVKETVLSINKKTATARPFESTGPIVVDNKHMDDNERRAADARVPVLLLGGTTLAYLMLLVFFGPSNLPPDYKPIIRFIAAIAAGLLSYFFFGSLHLGGKVPVIKTDVQVAAVGGFAIFIFVMIFWSH